MARGEVSAARIISSDVPRLRVFVARFLLFFGKRGDGGSGWDVFAYLRLRPFSAGDSVGLVGRCRGSVARALRRQSARLFICLFSC
jgi:hypothetical protein